MSWMPPELATPPEEEHIKCSVCGFLQFSDHFTSEDNYDVVCDDCVERDIDGN